MPGQKPLSSRQCPSRWTTRRSYAGRYGGGVKLSRGQGWIQAEKATIELATARVTATQVKGSIPVPKP